MRRALSSWCATGPRTGWAAVSPQFAQSIYYALPRAARGSGRLLGGGVPASLRAGAGAGPASDRPPGRPADPPGRGVVRGLRLPGPARFRLPGGRCAPLRPGHRHHGGGPVVPGPVARSRSLARRVVVCGLSRPCCGRSTRFIGPSIWCSPGMRRCAWPRRTPASPGLAPWRCSRSWGWRSCLCSSNCWRSPAAPGCTFSRRCRVRGNSSMRSSLACSPNAGRGRGCSRGSSAGLPTRRRPRAPRSC